MQKLKKDTLAKRAFKLILILMGVILVIFFSLFTPVDRTHWKDQEEVAAKMNQILDSVKAPQAIKGKLLAGWAKLPILPASPLPIASYGIRDNYKGIHDTVWCRTFVLDNGYSKVALITLDLLIFPPVIAEKIKPLLKEKGFDTGQTYFSASHTHNGPGGWAENIGGRFLAGPYNEGYVALIVKRIMQSVELAEKDMEQSSIGTVKLRANEFLANRYSNDPKDADDFLRLIKIKKATGKTGVLLSYSAHPTILNADVNEVGGDYAGALVDSLERQEGIDFAAFFAGAVGAHVCTNFKGKNYEAVSQIAGSLNQKVQGAINDVKLSDTVTLQAFRVPVVMGQPQLKIFTGWRIRPWLFHFLLGDQEVFLSALKINDITLIGTPCDFGGELVQNFSGIESEKGMHLFITSFNGGYVGYIVPDKYYDVDKRETRDMSWYGPHNAEYFTWLIQSILKKF